VITTVELTISATQKIILFTNHI